MGYDLYIGRLKSVEEESKKLEKIKILVDALSDTGVEIPESMKVQVCEIEDRLYDLTDGEAPIVFNDIGYAYIGDVKTTKVNDNIEVIDIQSLPEGTRYIALYHSY